MPDLTDYVVSPSDTIQHTMEKIDRNGMRAAIVVDEEKVVGTVSDGDIRRALLHNVILMSPVGGIMQLNPRVTTSADPQEREGLITKHNLTLLPIVDDENRLVDVQLAYEPF
jgi:CBS domain-containing protein